jgi:hypothetical protein
VGDFEYQFEEGTPSSDDEVLDTAPEHTGRLRELLRRFRVVSAVAAVAAGGTAVWLGVHDTTHRTPTAPASSEPAAAFVRPPSPEDVALDMTHAQARDPDTFVDFLRPTTDPGCRIVPIGSRSPVRTVTAVLHRYLPGFVVSDSSRTIDPNTELCALIVRARNAQGSVLVISVLPPMQGTVPGNTSVTYSRVDHLPTDTVTRVVMERTRDGWRIRVGTDGPITDKILEDSLESIADDDVLRW